MKHLFSASVTQSPQHQERNQAAEARQWLSLMESDETTHDKSTKIDTCVYVYLKLVRMCLESIALDQLGLVFVWPGHPEHGRQVFLCTASHDLPDKSLRFDVMPNI